jgi:glyoxylase-like metal-dependent hydrolase (beta-lactamase superfamily II)
VIEITERLTYWAEPHPDWTPNPEWPEEVGCVLYDGPDALVLIDPLIRGDVDPAAWTWLDEAVAASGRPVVVLLTAPWHERSTREVVHRYDARVWAAPAARPRVDALAQLEEIPTGISVFVPRGVDQGQVAFWIEPEQALVVAEFFLGTPGGLQVAPAPGTPDLEEFMLSLHELKRLPIERVLVGHGPPLLTGGSDAIAVALQATRA